MVWLLASLTAALNKLFMRSNFLSPAPSILYTHVPDCACGLCITTKKFGLRPVRPQIRNIRTSLCLSWPKIRYSWTRIGLFWRPKIRYFPDKHKRELQGAWPRSCLISHLQTTLTQTLAQAFINKAWKTSRPWAYGYITFDWLIECDFLTSTSTIGKFSHPQLHCKLSAMGGQTASMPS